MKLAIRLALILSLFTACSLRADSFIEPEIFINQKIEVFGLAGIPWESEYSHDEERARAWMDALHHAYEKILSLPLMEGKLVRHVMQTNAALKERLGLVLMSAPKYFQQADASGLIRCRLELPLTGKLSVRSALYLAAMRPQPLQPVSFLASWSAGLKVDENAPAPDFKRIIVDVRGSSFEPSLFPRFFDQTGMLIFQESMVPSGERFSRPAVRFESDIRKARAELEENETMTAAAYVSALSRRDISIDHADTDVFARFCRELIRNPLQEREIVIVFTPGASTPRGKLGKTEAKVEAEEKTKTPAVK
ncbi:MAG: hypothetical protein GQF41_1205 [Candidatus Rifleibacterium amylolyticum]|nr:MAG: hypothetical protein GQF41_1205 [Candidatus Rifleibacterium amylolyticum]